jgi:hypothetical protein
MRRNARRERKKSRFGIFRTVSSRLATSALRALGPTPAIPPNLHNQKPLPRKRLLASVRKFPKFSILAKTLDLVLRDQLICLYMAIL